MTRLPLSLSLAAAFACAVPVQAAGSASTHPSRPLVRSLLRQAPGLSANALKLALDAARSAQERGLVARRDLLTVIDYSIPSSKPRLFVFDLGVRKLLFRELCAHGRNSGDNMATYFSNDPGSLASSVGLFVTDEPYVGGNGYSLRLKGLEQGINDMAWSRMIVLHGAAYVSKAAIRALGRIGRSWGCPAVRPQIARRLIDTLRGGTALFAYYPEKSGSSSSSTAHATR